MGGGEDHHAAGNHGHYPGYPRNVWSTTGGYYCNPRNWRRNTAIAMAGIFLVCVPIFMKSAELEVHSPPPSRPIPSRWWNKSAQQAQSE